MGEKKERILVIRAGALGDLVFCCQAFADIRASYPDAEIALLTRAPFVEFARTMPWFDHIIADTHPKAWQIAGWLSLVSEIRRFRPIRVFDLQGKRRQNILFTLLGGPLGTKWSGAAPLCHYPRPWPPKPDMHFTQFIGAQLRSAGVRPAPPINFDWIDAPIEKFNLPDEYVVLIPGCTPDMPQKRWPPEKYADMANRLHARGAVCVAVGTKGDQDAITAIKNLAPSVIDLSGKTNLFELAGVLRHATCVIGNDTGPMHLAGAIGTPTLAVFSGHTNPVWSRPPGNNFAWRHNKVLAKLSVDEVWFAFGLLLQHAGGKVLQHTKGKG